MADAHHRWSLDEPLPYIRPHSLAKHRVLQKYLARYLDVLTGDVRIPALKLTLVDGFSGGGIYLDPRSREERYGSPFLMLKTMQEAAAIAETKRKNGFDLDVEYFFIEESKATFECLKVHLETSEFRGLVGTRIQLRNDTFMNQFDKVIERVKVRGRGNRAIFVLDQFGYLDVPFHAIRRILSELENAEIILTFATDSLINYLNGHEISQRILEKLGLQIGSDAIRTAKQERDWREAIQLMLHDQIFVQSRAKFYTPFFIRSKDANRDYWLIHLSNHARARDVMVGLHWAENTSFAHYGGSGLVMLGYDPDQDLSLTGHRRLPEFCFDDRAHEATTSCLMDDLPGRIYPHKDGITFKALFSGHTNDAPATSDIFKEVIAKLAKEGILSVEDQSGTVKREAGVQKASDVIIPSRQKRLFVGPN